MAYDVLGHGHGETTASFQVGRGAVSQRDGSHLVDKQQTGQGTGVQGDEGGRRTTQLRTAGNHRRHKGLWRCWRCCWR